ncbi:solute carrier family 49 member 4 homolog [Ylistrum balloti]|uniref:solute carrier family 49 member 4 homolog n=1 Tax=Ylistrum balloti TaxID=509963 RepID=UPI002905CE72|nr:solute carrier family 49 member 4 homolog [Ylistrum balloti]
MDEVKPLLLLKPKAYARRWWVLMYVSLVMVFIVLSWNTWGPISQSVEYGFGWDNSIIADILTVGRIGAFCSIIPLSYLADMKGIRYAMITSTTMVLAGYGFRCAINQSTSTWPALLGQIFVGSGMGIAYSGPVAMSAAWFPPKERATATSITVMCTYFGYGMAYIIHPLLVSTPVFGEDVSSYWNTNQTERINYTDHNLSTAATLTNGSSGKIVLNKDKIQEETMTMTYIETVIAAVLVVVGVTLLPNVPPSPPSYSANAVKMGYTRVFLHVKRKKLDGLDFLVS